MANVGKRMRAIQEKIQPGKSYPIDDALSLIKDCASAKFLESVDVAVNLGVDPRKSDQVVRGATVLPNGTGKTVRVAVFAQGANAEAAKEAGADIVGFEDLAEQVKAGQMNFDVVIASPDAMRVVGQLGPILGPRGLMPNPKVGTVTPDVAGAVRNAKGGRCVTAPTRPASSTAASASRTSKFRPCGRTFSRCWLICRRPSRPLPRAFM